MLVERTIPVANVEVVGEAYDIAANGPKKTGATAFRSRVSRHLA